MVNRVSETDVSRWRFFWTVIVPFIAGVPFVFISRQAWIVSLLLVVVVGLITWVSVYFNKKEWGWGAFFTGDDYIVPRGVASFFIGATLVYAGVYVRNHWYETRAQREHQEQFERRFSDMENISAVAAYFHSNGITPSVGELAKLNIPIELRQATLGYCSFLEQNYREARELFKSDQYHNPISKYYLGLMTYLGLDDIPKDEGLDLIREAADLQVLDANSFLFYQAIKEQDVSHSEKYAKEILSKKMNSNISVYSPFYQKYVNPQNSVNVFFLGRLEVLNTMANHYLKWGKDEKALNMIEDCFSAFEGYDDVITSLKIRYLEFSGNNHLIHRELSKGARQKNPYSLMMSAEALLKNNDGRFKNGADISERDFRRAERNLKTAMIGGEQRALDLLKRLYRERGYELAAIEADHMYSLVKMVSDVKQAR